jgi:hypothetical protein
VRCVEGSWVQPTISCPKTGYEAVSIWVGIDGMNSGATGVDASKTLEQIGTQVECVDGKLRSFAWEEVLPAEPKSVVLPLVVRPGDRIRVRVLYDTDDRFHMRIENVTRKTSHSVTKAVKGAPRQTAEWVVEAVSKGCPKACKVQPLADFGQIDMSRCEATIGSERGPIDDRAWTTGQLTMRSSVVLALTSAVDDTGLRFGVTWVHR